MIFLVFFVIRTSWWYID